MATRTINRGYTRPARPDLARIEESVGLPLDDIDVDVQTLADEIAELRATVALLSEQAVMTGEIRIWPFSTAPPGYLLIDGSAVTTRYSTLRQLILNDGARWGRNGSGDPFLPPTPSRGLMGAGTGAGLTTRRLGDLPGVERVSLTSAQNGPHAHGYSDPGHNHGGNTSGPEDYDARVYGSNGADHHHTITWDGAFIGGDPGAKLNSIYHVHAIPVGYAGISIFSSGSGQAHENVHSSVVVNFIVKT